MCAEPRYGSAMFPTACRSLRSFLSFRALVAASCLATVSVGCGTAKPGGMSGPTINGKINKVQPSAVESSDILDREPVANRVKVKHILIGFRDLEESYGGRMDERAKNRSKREAEAAITDLMGQLKAGAVFEALMLEHSEDSASTQSGESMEVEPSSGLVLEFKRLALRLNVGEYGVVLTSFGFHIIKRDA